MSKIAIIGGTGLGNLNGLNIIKEHQLDTPYGATSAPLIEGELNGQSVVFLARHGLKHNIAPHKINYRANLWALSSLSVKQIIAIAAVGGISEKMKPQSIAVPDQIIDYTYGRKLSFFEDDFSPDKHIDFTYPYTESIRQALLAASTQLDFEVINKGVYAATQGPRLETAAEINRLANDGCDLVGMTGMPEAALARELDIDYASCTVVANWAAGRCEDLITIKEIEDNLAIGMENIRLLIEKALPQLG